MLKSTLLSFVALFVSVSASAQTATDVESITLIIEGEVTEITSSNGPSGLLEEHNDVVSAKVEVELATETPLTPWLDSDFMHYGNSVIAVRYSFYDADQQLVDLGHPAVFQASENDEITANYKVFLDNNELMFIENRYKVDGATFQSYVNVRGMREGGLYELVNNYYRVKEDPLGEYGYTSMWSLRQNSSPQTTYSLNVTSLQYVTAMLDADGDGVADADDLCATTEVSDTVVFDGVNSGVTNTVDANGCSIMDRYASCAAAQQDGGMLGYTGPTHCEMMMGYQLYREGVIDYTELRMLRNAL